MCGRGLNHLVQTAATGRAACPDPRIVLVAVSARGGASNARGVKVQHLLTDEGAQLGVMDWAPGPRRETPGPDQETAPGGSYARSSAWPRRSSTWERQKHLLRICFHSEERNVAAASVRGKRMLAAQSRPEGGSENSETTG